MTDDIDREAARKALARNWPNLEPSSSQYAKLCEGLAEFHHRFGAESFELRYNLRPPKDRTELWVQQEMSGQITEEELRSRLKADAERPIDLEMLNAFYAAYQERLKHYSGVLQKAVIRPSEAGTLVVQENEEAIEEHISAMVSPLQLWRENLQTVFEYLEELRITSGAGLVKLMDYEATSAHWLAQLIFSRMSDAWQSCREISDRSHTDPRYSYAAEAIELFNQCWLSKFPAPQIISERLREEFVLARVAIKRSSENIAEAIPSDVRTTANNANADWSIDNQSRELILIGDVTSIVASAGHIFRPTSNCDWGIDGEIEFKDQLGHASGKRVYVQLKSGDSYLTQRVNDGEEVFTVKNLRHLSYWKQQAYPVMLVIRQSSGLVRWMDVSAYLKQAEQPSPQIIFRGEPVTAVTIRKLAESHLEQSPLVP
jgi:hypothetical protein